MLGSTHFGLDLYWVLHFQINGEDVSSASHEHVVDLIRNSGSLVSMTVISVNAGGGGGVPSSRSVAQLSQPQMQAARQYATLPRKAAGGGGRSPAPAPPRRDPRTTLSVGKARAKSMVAGLGNNKLLYFLLIRKRSKP